MLPVAETAMLPLFCPAPEVCVTVPVTEMVTPLHGFVGPPPPPLLPHDKKMIVKENITDSESKFIFLISGFVVVNIVKLVAPEE